MRASKVAAALDDPPTWLGDFGAYLVGRHHPSRACKMLTRLGKRLADTTTPEHPQTLLESIAADVPLARALEDFLTASKLALAPDRAERRAAQRRQRRVDAVPEPLQPAMAEFAEHLIAGRDRARRAGTHPRGHATLEARLTAVRDFAQFLTTRNGKTDWATVDVGDIEAFLHAHPGRRPHYLTGLRQFSRYGVRRRLMLIDPTAGLTAPQTMAFAAPPWPPTGNANCSAGGAATPACTRTSRSSGWQRCSTAPPPKNSNTSPTPTSTTNTTTSGWVVDRSRPRWTRGPGPHCNTVSTTATH